jgi:hypothetical protein
MNQPCSFEVEIELVEESVLVDTVGIEPVDDGDPASVGFLSTGLGSAGFVSVILAAGCGSAVVTGTPALGNAAGIRGGIDCTVETGE